MAANITFGECLKFMLSTLDISINRLSKAINVDNSLVSRWIHESRIPGYNTHYIENISEYLSRNVYNTFQEERLNLFFLSVHGDYELEGNIKEKIIKVLLEAQGYSIECKKEKLRENKNQKSYKEDSPKFTFNEKTKFNAMDKVNDEELVLNDNYPSKSVNLSNEDKMIFGIENVIDESINLIEIAAKKRCVNDNNTIYLSYYKEIDSYHYNSLIILREALLKAINKGWNIVILLKIDSDINRLMKFVHFSKPLLKSGRFYPYYIKKYDNALLAREILVIPEIGAVSCFSTNINSTVDCAFYFKSKTAIRTLKDWYNAILANGAKALITYYSPENSIDYGRYLTECEEGIGNRFLYKYNFSVATLPAHLYEKLLRKKKLSRDEMLVELELYKKRVNAFLSNLQIYEYKDIYMEDSIRLLIKHRQFHYYNYSGVEIMELEIEDIIEYVQNIIYLLLTYENYSITFVNRSNMENHNLNCMVKERKAVLFEAYEPSKSVAKVQLSIEEPTIVKAFYGYFEEIWKHIAPVNNDKNEVIKWLKSQINVLEKMASKKSKRK